MTVKEQVLNVMENNRGRYFSGVRLAEELSVSRAAIWKSIKELQKQGYDIYSDSSKGYCLSEQTNILSSQGIEKYLGDIKEDFCIQIFQTVTSTNTLAIDKAVDGAKEGTVIIAEEQSAGRGRLGRKFFSPKDTGIYLSMILKPKIQVDKALYITTAAAVAVAEAIEEVLKIKADIKWVNDIYCNNKKVAGILTEASFNMENSNLDYAVLGIGINVENPKEGFPKELMNIAAGIVHTPINDVRSKLIAEILKRFWNYYNNILKKEFFKKYKNRLFIIEKTVDMYYGGNNEVVKVLDINDEFQLIVEDEDGNVKTISSGEVSIRVGDD